MLAGDGIAPAADDGAAYPDGIVESPKILEPEGVPRIIEPERHTSVPVVIGTFPAPPRSPMPKSPKEPPRLPFSALIDPNAEVPEAFSASQPVQEVEEPPPPPPPAQEVEEPHSADKSSGAVHHSLPFHFVVKKVNERAHNLVLFAEFLLYIPFLVCFVFFFMYSANIGETFFVVQSFRSELVDFPFNRTFQKSFSNNFDRASDWVTWHNDIALRFLWDPVRPSEA
eukprot:RCo027674